MCCALKLDRHHRDATLSRALAQNDNFIQQEREMLDAWAEDHIATPEKALKNTKLKRMGLKRQPQPALV